MALSRAAALTLVPPLHPALVFPGLFTRSHVKPIAHCGQSLLSTALE